MDLLQHLLALEERFWKSDAEFYQNHLTDDSLMVFADPVGVLTKSSTIRSITNGPRWSEVELDDVRILMLSADAAMLTYTAAARRQGDSVEYSTRASSAYVKRGGAWNLAFHQQTPRGAAAEQATSPGTRHDPRSPPSEDI